MNVVTNVNKWVVDFGATGTSVLIKVCLPPTLLWGMEKNKFILVIQGKWKVLLKLTSEKTLALNDALHVPSIKVNLVSVVLLGKVGVKISFEYDKIVMTKNNVFVGNGYCDQGFFVLMLIQRML